MREDEAFKAMALVAGVTVLLTIIACDAWYAKDVRDAQAHRAEVAYEAGECVKHPSPGWTFDACQIKAVKNAEEAIKRAEVCSDLVTKHRDFTRKDFEAACNDKKLNSSVP